MGIILLIHALIISVTIITFKLIDYNLERKESPKDIDQEVKKDFEIRSLPFSKFDKHGKKEFLIKISDYSYGFLKEVRYTKVPISYDVAMNAIKTMGDYNPILKKSIRRINNSTFVDEIIRIDDLPTEIIAEIEDDFFSFVKD